VEFDVLVGEEDEGGWGDGGLGHVVDADAAVLAAPIFGFRGRSDPHSCDEAA
jgi:hypothetical protein